MIKKMLHKINVLPVILRCWRGEASLSFAFWVMYVFFGLIQALIIETVFHSYISGSYIYYNVHNHWFDLAVTCAFPWLFISSMFVWSSGKNSWIEWNIISKIIVSIPLAIASFHLVF